MRAVPIVLLGAGLVFGSGVAQAAPEDDLKAFRHFYQQRFPDVPFEDFANGIYAIDESRREEWEQMEEFPQYEFDIDAGEVLFHEQFANARSMADCFPGYESGVRQNYPYWDAERGEVVTMEWAINMCREANDEKPLKYRKGPLAQISAYLAYLSRGNVIDVKIPAGDPRALAAYEEGQRFYYSRRGSAQLLLRVVPRHRPRNEPPRRAHRPCPRSGEPLSGLSEAVGKSARCIAATGDASSRSGPGRSCRTGSIAIWSTSTPT